jgi:phosphatidate cytidylyltransferase
LSLLVIFIWGTSYIYPNPLEIVILSIVIFSSILSYKRDSDPKLFLPLLYPTVPLLFIFMLYKEYGIEALIWLLVVVSLTDTAAYFVGKTIGKTQFCETSPKKTLEGVVGGVIIASFLGSFVALDDLPLILAIVVSIAISIASVFGDLFESYLKREAGVKDSGDILPGHGGVLDRLDGYLFAVIVMYICLNARGVIV